MSQQNPRCAGTPYKTTCGGQALIEGIMMQGPEQRAVVVRKPDGTLDITTTPVKKRRGLAALPFIRGIFVFCSSMVNGVKALMHSAEVSDDGTGEEEELTGLDKWIADHFPEEKAACHVRMEAVKLSEDGTGKPVLRLYEAAGVPQRVRLLLPEGMENACAEETNLLEEVQQELAVKDGSLTMEFKAFEIRTVVLDF